MMPFHLAGLAATVLLVFWIARGAGAQVLRTDGEHFTVDGRRTFMVFVSSFDGLSRIPDDLGSTAVLDPDFDYFLLKGPSGIRVFPNWKFRSETMMDCNGVLRPIQLKKLKTFL